MKEFSIIAVTLFNIGLTIYNFWLIKNQKTKSSLAMWLFFTIAVLLSLITFKSESSYTFLDNILNTTDLMYVGISTLAIFLYGDKSTKLNRFDLYCLGGVGVIFIFWLVTQEHLTANLLVQLILVIAYFPVINRMVKTKENTESFVLWSCMLVISSIALISTEGFLAHVYVIRAMVSILLLMGIMAWFSFRRKA